MPDQRSMSSKRFRERTISGRSDFSELRPTTVVHKPVTMRRQPLAPTITEVTTETRICGRLTLKDGKVSGA